MQGARRITVTDPYIRMFHQARNMMELLETVVRLKAVEDEVTVHLVTALDEYKAEAQIGYLEKMSASAAGAGVTFTWEFDGTGTIHARHIVTDTGWKILLDRGLDVFGFYEMNEAFAFSNRMQQFRGCKAFEVTYLRV
jgi:ATP-dependent Lon protease